MPNDPPRIPGYEPVKFLAWSCGGLGGEIHLARREADHALVALRVGSGKLPDPQVETMALLRRLRHPNILAVVDVGEHQGRWYVALEWAAPGTLSSRLKAGRLPWAEALRVTGGLATAAICMRCLAKPPQDRYATPDDLARAISSVAGSGG